MLTPAHPLTTLLPCSGPLTCVSNGRHVLYGITSWGKGCGRRNQPGMYTKITKFLRWIQETIN